MALSIRKVWLWIKLIVIILVVAWVTLFFVKNADNKANVWLFFWVSTSEPISLDIIVPITAVVSVLVYYVVRKIAGVWGQLSQVRESEKARDQEKRMHDLARQVEQKLSPGQTAGKEPKP